MAKLTCFLAGVILVGIMAQAAAEEGCMATWTLRDLDQQEERDEVKTYQRLTFGEVNVRSGTGEDVYVKMIGCPTGTKKMDHVSTFRLNAGTATDPKAVAAKWWDYCTGHDECREGGEGFSDDNQCCPEGAERAVAFFTPQGGTLSTICTGKTDREYHEGGNKAAWQVYDDPVATGGFGDPMKVSEYFKTRGDPGGIAVKAKISGEKCIKNHADAKLGMVYGMPPVPTGSVAAYFEHYAGQDGDQKLRDEPTRTKYAVFRSAKSMPDKDNNGTCTLFVDLGHVVKTNGEDDYVKGMYKLMSVDGVEMSCMDEAYAHAPLERIAMGMMGALGPLTKQGAPKPGDNLKVDILVDGTRKTFTVKLDAASWDSLKMQDDAVDKSKNKCYRPRKTETHGDNEREEHDWNWQGDEAKNTPSKVCARKQGMERGKDTKREDALKTMTSNVYSFVSFWKQFDMQSGRRTGNAPWDNQDPANWEGGECLVTVEGLMDKDGKAICTDEMLATKEKVICNYTTMKSEQAKMAEFVDEMTNGEVRVEAEQMGKFTAKSNWAGCMSMVTSSLVDNIVQEKVTTDQCVKPMNSNSQTFVDPRTHCSGNPNDAFCKDACCNPTLKETTCCVATEQNVEVNRPKLNVNNLGKSCFRGSANVGKVVELAYKYLSAQSTTQNCFSDKKAIDRSYMDNVGRTCGRMVDGSWWHHKGGKGKSMQITKQACNTDDDCFTGTCTDVEHVEDWWDADMRKSDREGKKYLCESVYYTDNATVAKTALGKCILNEISVAQDDGARVNLAKLLGVAKTATAAQIGKALDSFNIVEERCEGFHNAHKFTFGSGEKECTTRDDCRSKCLAKKRCNWNHDIRNEAECKNGFSHYCEFKVGEWHKEPIGVAKPSKCLMRLRQKGRTRYECHDGDNTVSHWEKHEMEGQQNLTEAQCTALGGTRVVQNVERVECGDNEIVQRFYTCQFNASNARECFMKNKVDQVLRQTSDSYDEEEGAVKMGTRDLRKTCYLPVTNPPIRMPPYPGERYFKWECKNDPNDPSKQVLSKQMHGHVQEYRDGSVNLPAGFCEKAGLVPVRKKLDDKHVPACNGAEERHEEIWGHGCGIATLGGKWLSGNWVRRQYNRTWCESNQVKTDVEWRSHDSRASKSLTEAECTNLGMVREQALSIHHNNCTNDWQEVYYACYDKFDNVTVGGDPIHAKYWLQRDGNGFYSEANKIHEWRIVTHMWSHGTERTEDLCTTLLPNAELKVDYERHRGMNSGNFHHDHPLCFWSNLTRPEFDARKGNWNGFDKFFEDHVTDRGQSFPRRNNQDVKLFYARFKKHPDEANKKNIEFDEMVSTCAAYGGEFSMVLDWEGGTDDPNVFTSQSECEKPYCFGMDPSFKGDITEDQCKTFYAGHCMGECPNHWNHALDSCWKNKTMCEAKGTCHGTQLRQYKHMPQMDSDGKLVRGEDGRVHWEEVERSHTCVVPKENGKCRGEEECRQNEGKESKPNSDVCQDGRDPRYEHAHDDKCLAFKFTTEQACNAADGEWLENAHNKATCEESPLYVKNNGQKEECHSGKGSFEVDIRRRSKTECEKCGGAMSTYQEWHPMWATNTFEEATLQTGMRKWKERAVEPEGRIAIGLEEWRISSVMRSVQNSFRDGGDSDMIQCLYGRMGKDLVKIASICGTGAPSGDAMKAVLAEPERLIVKKVVAGEKVTLGAPKETKVNIREDSIEGELTLALDSSMAQRTSKTRRRVRRRGLLTDDAQTVDLDAASCYSVVRNSADKLVGQLVGDCVQMVKTSGDGRIVNDIEMCIEVNGKIKRNADYSEADFAIRTGTYGEYKYTPLGLTTTDSGSHLCADRKTLDEYYCPILRVPGWSSKSADTGTEGCAAMETVVKAAAVVATETEDKCSNCDGCCDLSTAEQVEKKKADPTFKIEDPSATAQACVGIACTRNTSATAGNTSAPAAGTTSAPAANTTSAPAAGTTSAPAAGTTSAPAANTTSAPAAGTTSAPAADPTMEASTTAAPRLPQRLGQVGGGSPSPSEDTLLAAATHTSASSILTLLCMALAFAFQEQR